MKTVLFIDNDADFLDTRAEYLEEAGYKVVKAYTLDQAEQLLNWVRIHLAILDIRIVDDDDERDTSGLTLAKELSYRALPKIMLTGFPTYQAVREVLGPALDGISPAVDFLSKQEGTYAMVEAVKQSFIQHVRINWDLDIRWNERESLSFPHIVTLVDSDSDYLLDRTGEMEDLFRKLFYDYDQITISRLFWRKETRVALEVCAYSKQKEEQFVVTCGRVQDIELERKHYEDTAPNNYVAVGTVIALSAETLHFAATAWTIPGVTIEETNTIAEFYRQSNGAQVRTVLDHLFQISLAPWYQGGRFVDGGNALGAIYRKQYKISAEALSLEAFRYKIQALCNAASAANLVKITLDNGRLSFQFPNGETISVLDPLPYIYGDIPFPNTDAVCGAIPGNLDVRNILVDADSESTWLTDFSQAGIYPIWQDAVSLEVSTRFHFVDALDIFAVFEFEKQLLDIRYLSDTVSSVDIRSEHKKILTAIRTIRRQIADVAGEEPLPYYIGLLFCAVNELVKYDPAVRQPRREIASLLHRLLFAGMLCQEISRSENTVPSEKAKDIRIDEDNRQIWVAGKEVVLTSTEFKLLLYLYHRAGKLCKRSAIIRDVFDYEAASRETERSLLNTHIGRLRQKIETDSGHPKHIVTVRGQGYKLIIQPK